MNREEFREILAFQPQGQYPSFIEYFGNCLTHMTGDYISLYTRIPVEQRPFMVTGVEEALISYCWPARIEHLHPGGALQAIFSYEESFEALSHYRQGITQAMAGNGNVIEWAGLILNWGMGARGEAAMNFLEARPEPAEYLNAIDLMSNLDGDTDNIVPQEVPNYNSGLSKIHSLASTSGLVIYDSRVAFSIGECVNGWAMATGLHELPVALRFMQAGRKSHNPTNRNAIQKPRGYGVGFRHPSEKRDSRWLETQMRASWLFEAALERNPNLWAGEDMPVRMHKLEAAFFMFGAYAESITLP